MAKQQRVRRPPGELKKELQEQVILLESSCEKFDQGQQAFGKLIALNLRVLLHHQGRSQALLQQLGLRDGRFLDSAGDLTLGNLLPENRLIFMRVGADGVYLPRLGFAPGQPRWLKFEDWWNIPVVKDNKGRTLHRRDLVLHVAETDGGAHVDPELEETYMELSRRNSLGWVIRVDGEERPFPSPAMASIRQIAHELLKTLQVKAAADVVVSYELARPV